MAADSLLRGSSSPLSPVHRLRKHRNYRRNTLAALGISLLVLGFLATPDVLHRMQHHTLTVEECNGSKCTTEVVNVHDTAMLNDTLHTQNPQAQTGTQVNTPDSRLGSVTIQKQVGKPLVVTVKQDESDPGLQVRSGGALLTDDAKVRVALLNQAASQSNLSLAESASAEKAASIAEDLSKHGAAAQHEGDNVLDIHRDDIDLSTTEANPVSVKVSDENSHQIMQDSNSSSLLSGFNSEKQREHTEEQQQQQQRPAAGQDETDPTTFTGVTVESARRHLLRKQPGYA